VPESYVADPRQRIEIYRKLHRCADTADLESLRQEMRDRFGELPRAAENMLSEARLRRLAEEVGVASITLPTDRAQRSAHRMAGRLVVMSAADEQRVVQVLTAAQQDYRQVDERLFELRLPTGARRGGGRTGGTRISGEFLLSFLTRVLERGMSALAALAEDPRGD